MLYSIGLFVLDTEKEILLLASTKEVVSDHPRVSQILSTLVNAYPKTVTKNELTTVLWPEGDVTEWALSRQISQLRQLLSTYDTEGQYIKTVHTKGFKLEIEPIVIETQITEPANKKNTRQSESPESNKSTAAANKRKTFYSLFLIVGFFISLALIFLGYHFVSNRPVYGEILPKKNIIFPVNENWFSLEPNTIRYTPEGILIEPIGEDALFVYTHSSQAAFYQGAIFSIKMKVNQEFVDNKGWLRLYYQTTLGGWPGEWDCGVPQSIIHTLDFEYRCVIDENGTYVKILDKEWVNFGIKIHQMKPVGHAIIKSAELEIPANISTDQGWQTSNGAALEYDRGVAFYPKSTADHLVTKIKGPHKIQGSKIAFTIEIDDSFKQPDYVLQFFILNKEGKWQDCFINGTEINSNVFTKICEFQNIYNPFILNDNQIVEIGIKPNGKRVSKKLKILGVSISE
jgi:DNA-binding winged helix-turn-helix (wHTH) protein